jgi:hypothetical protein
VTLSVECFLIEFFGKLECSDQASVVSGKGEVKAKDLAPGL